MTHLIFKNETNAHFLVDFEGFVPATEDEPAHWATGVRPSTTIKPEWIARGLQIGERIQQLYIGAELRALIEGDGQLIVKNHSQAPIHVRIHKQTLKLLEDEGVGVWVDAPHGEDTRIGPNDQWAALFFEKNMRYRLTQEG